MIMDLYEYIEEQRLHMDGIEVTEPKLELSKEEVRTLYTWVKNEFIPRDQYNEINSLLKKMNDFMAR